MSSAQAKYSIRRATIDDAESITEILVEGWLWAYSSFMPPEFLKERTDRVSRLERVIENWRFDHLHLAAVDEAGAVCGFASEHIPCSLPGFDAEIGGLYVHPRCARSGIGGMLVRSMAGEFMARGCRSMAICCLVENSIGCAFYTRMGGVRDKQEIWNGMQSVWFVWEDVAVLGS